MPVRLAMTVDEGTDEDETTRCAGLPGFRILQLSSDVSHDLRLEVRCASCVQRGGGGGGGRGREGGGSFL